MQERKQGIAGAWLESPDSGIVELRNDWPGPELPPLRLGTDDPEIICLDRRPPVEYGRTAGFFRENDSDMVFLLEPSRFGDVDWGGIRVYVAGDFNGWEKAIGDENWRLLGAMMMGVPFYRLRQRVKTVGLAKRPRFKFVTGDGRWLPVSADAPNAEFDERGNLNHVADPDRTGWHRYEFRTRLPVDVAAIHAMVWEEEGNRHVMPLSAGDFFFHLRSEERLGAMIEGGRTVFRLFAPRASAVWLLLQRKADSAEPDRRLELSRGKYGAWELTVDEDLHRWYYWYQVDGPRHELGFFDPEFRIADPYARALVDHVGPGIVLRDSAFPEVNRPFEPPPWQDLLIAEVHVRDLIARAPMRMSPRERLGFTGLARWVRSDDFYLAHLGVNAVELQPIQEFDNRSPDEYHWGYMPTNWFSPESGYSLDPVRGSQIEEFRDVVRAFHERDMAVILDVVYNHVGEPAHLLYLDKLYYFHLDASGRLLNWSGCGNDFRAEAAMARRLIIDSLIYLVKTFDVDGFRFDLAELLGVEVLREIEAELKKVKPGIILIAEPWSFRGHIAAALRPTGFASWNDGYRDYVRDYVLGRAGADGLEYFLKGSPYHFAFWPAQTVNYTASHDDRSWIDRITENPNNDGSDPTQNDRRRTHLMAAILFSSIGIPMIAAGQDFLRSKRGVNNTYQRGDLNALDYRRIYRFSGTHGYFSDWIRFRRSPVGRFFRHYTRPPDTFFRFFQDPGHEGLAVIYNADGSIGPGRLLLALNPHPHEITLPVGDAAEGGWTLAADHERFYPPGTHDLLNPVTPELYLPPFGVGVWLGE